MLTYTVLRTPDYHIIHQWRSQFFSLTTYNCSLIKNFQPVYIQYSKILGLSLNFQNISDDDNMKSNGYTFKID